MYVYSYATWKQHKATTATFPHLDWLTSSQPSNNTTQRWLLGCRTVLPQVYVWDSLVMEPWGAWSCLWWSFSKQHAHRLLPCYCQCVQGFNASLEGGDGKEAESFEQIPTGTKGSEAETATCTTPVCKTTGSRCGHRALGERAVPWRMCPEAHNAGSSNPTRVLLLQGEFECCLWA